MSVDEPVDEVPNRDVLRAAVPFVAAGVVVYAAATDPAHPARVAVLAAAAALFGGWALRPDRVPSLLLTAGVVPAVVLAKGTGDLDVGLLLVVLLAIVVAGWERSAAVVAAAGVAAGSAPLLVGVLRPGDVDVGIWLAGIAFAGLMSRLFHRQEELRAQLAESRRRLAARAVADERQRIARDVHDLAGRAVGPATA